MAERYAIAHHHAERVNWPSYSMVLLHHPQARPLQVTMAVNFFVTVKPFYRLSHSAFEHGAHEHISVTGIHLVKNKNNSVFTVHEMECRHTQTGP